MEKKTSGMMNFAGVGVNFSSPDIQTIKSLEDLDKLGLLRHLATNQSVKNMAERGILMALGISSADINDQFQARSKAIQDKFESGDKKVPLVQFEKNEEHEKSLPENEEPLV